MMPYSCAGNYGPGGKLQQPTIRFVTNCPLWADCQETLITSGPQLIQRIGLL